MNNSGQKITASDIRLAMRKQWAEQEWAILWEVREGTGTMAGRSADAVMMSLWPSRGLELHGVEIKVSRSDWKREAGDPTKAEAIAKYCDRWWVHTSPGIVQDISELPPMWGLREFNGRNWRTIREAHKSEPQPINRVFLAALLRRSDELMKSLIRDAMESSRAGIDEERARMREGFDQRLKEEVARRTSKTDDVQKQISKFEKAFGRKVNSFSPNMTAIGKAAAAIVDCDNAFKASSLAKRLREAADALDEISLMTTDSDAA